jgi:hypothetical protein
VELNASGRIEGASFYNNIGSGLCVAESEKITVTRNYFGDNMEIRNMEDRAVSVRDISIESNRFEDAKVISSIGALTRDSFRTLNISADYNVFDNGSNDWYNWKGIRANTGEEIYAAWGVDRTATAGSVSIPRT